MKSSAPACWIIWSAFSFQMSATTVPTEISGAGPAGPVSAASCAGVKSEYRNGFPAGMPKLRTMSLPEPTFFTVGLEPYASFVTEPTANVTDEPHAARSAAVTCATLSSRCALKTLHSVSCDVSMAPPQSSHAVPDHT